MKYRDYYGVLGLQGSATQDEDRRAYRKLAQVSSGREPAGRRRGRVTGLKGTFSKEENVFKVSNPRTDIKVVADGWTHAAVHGLDVWAAFTPAHGFKVMLMGDSVLWEDEINPAVSAALDAGLEVTHNHFFFNQLH